MTVGELVAQLLALPQDDRVFVDGYEQGYDDPKDVRAIVYVPHPSNYCGQYEDASSDTEWDEPRRETFGGWIVPRYDL